MDSIADRRRGWALLALIVAGMLGVKLAAWPAPVGHHALDGSNYYQVAEQVAAGDGLQTRLSLYHQGFRSFPHASNIYPAWPLALGYAARVVDLPTAAVALPIALYCLAILLVYALANRCTEALAGRKTAAGSVAGLNVGHAAALLFALNPVFFRHTSLPYAEGLVYASAFGALVALDRTREPRAAAAWALLAGGLAGISFLARPQMLPLPFAIVGAMALTAHGRRDAWATACAGAAALGAVLLWAAHLATFVQPFSLAVLFDYAAYRETPSLAPFPVTLTLDTWPEFVLDRLAGFGVALSPTHPNGYARSFGLAVYLLPLALVALAMRAPTVRDAWNWCRRRETRTVVATLLAGAGALTIVHLHHGTLIWEWWFHWRHGLPLILPLVLALAVLFAWSPAWMRGVATALIAWTVLTNALEVRHTAEFLRQATFGPSSAETDLVAWADALPEEPSLISTKAQALAAFSRRAGFHWTFCGDDPAQTRTLFADAHADYLILYPGEEHCPGVAALLPSLRVVRGFGGIRVLEPDGPVRPALAHAG